MERGPIQASSCAPKEDYKVRLGIEHQKTSPRQDMQHHSIHRHAYDGKEDADVGLNNEAYTTSIKPCIELSEPGRESQQLQSRGICHLTM
jgi:hypothetical protein